jgi:hypothetical protein
VDIDFALITLIALVMAILFQPVRKYVDRQAHLSYIERVGSENAAEVPEHPWLEDRHLVGRWGCLYLLLQAIQGIAVMLTIGGVVYWWLF